ncbi:MAG: FkbM family methyltransferase [Pseudomonadota bacterium]
MPSSPRNRLRQLLNSVGLLRPLQAGIYWRTQFDPTSTHPRRVMRRFYEPFIKRGDLVFDIGANRGQRIDIFLELGAKIVAVEPQQACVDYIRQHFPSRNLVLIHKGLGSRDGELVEMNICKELDSISSMSQDFLQQSRFATQYGYAWEKSGKVELTTLDRLIATHGVPAFCKIDVEGYEVEVLSGLSQALPCISFEYNREFHQRSLECAAKLDALGSYHYNFGRAEPEHLMFAQWLTAAELFNRLHEHTDNLLWGDIYARRLSP